MARRRYEKMGIALIAGILWTICNIFWKTLGVSIEDVGGKRTCDGLYDLASACSARGVS
jgi:hypothetical protein